MCVLVTNADDEPIPRNALIFEAASFGAFVPGNPVAKVAVGSLEPGESREVSTVVPRSRLESLNVSRFPPPKRWTPGFDALLDTVRHTHWIGNFNVYFDRRPDQAVERHRAFGLKVPVGEILGAAFMVGVPCEAQVSSSDPAWIANVELILLGTVLLRVQTPEVVGACANITTYVSRNSDGKIVPVEFEFEAVRGWGQSAGCVKVGP